MTPAEVEKDNGTPSSAASTGSMSWTIMQLSASLLAAGAAAAIVTLYAASREPAKQGIDARKCAMPDVAKNLPPNYHYPNDQTSNQARHNHFAKGQVAPSILRAVLVKKYDFRQSDDHFHESLRRHPHRPEVGLFSELDFLAMLSFKG